VNFFQLAEIFSNQSCVTSIADAVVNFESLGSLDMDEFNENFRKLFVNGRHREGNHPFIVPLIAPIRELY